MQLTIGFHYQHQPSDIQGFLDWINSLPLDACELIVVDDRPEEGDLEFLKKYPFDKHVEIRLVSFSLQGKANAYNHIVDQAKHPYLMFVTAQHRFDATQIKDMVQLLQSKAADVVVAPIDHKHLPWHQRRAYPKPFTQIHSIFDDPSLLVSFTDTIYGKIFNVDFLKQNRVHFMEFDTMLGIPFLSTVYAYRAKIAYAYWLSLDLGTEMFEQGHKDIFKALDKIVSLYRRMHIDDLFAKELNYLILRKIIVNNVLVSKELKKDERTLLLKQCKNYIKRRGVVWDNPYFAADDKWLRLNYHYVKMIIG